MRNKATLLRAEQSRAEQSRAEQSRAEQSRAEQSRAEQRPPDLAGLVCPVRFGGFLTSIIFIRKES